MSVGAGDGCFPPARKVCKEAGAEVAGGVEAGLGEWGDDGNQNRHAEANEHRRESQRWAGLVARVRDGEDDEGEDGGSQDFRGEGDVERNRARNLVPVFGLESLFVGGQAAGSRIVFPIAHGRDDAPHLAARDPLVQFLFLQQRAIEQKQGSSGEHRSAELSQDVSRHARPIKAAPERQGDGDGWVDMCPADSAADIGGQHDGHAPDNCHLPETRLGPG